MDKSLEEQLQLLRSDLTALQQEVYRNNFSSHQDFQKFSNFATRLKIPHVEQLPPVCEQGEITEMGGVMYICSSSNSWSVV